MQREDFVSSIENATASWVLVLAGGDGTRLQGLTRAIAGQPIPKQYCKLLAGRSLLEATLERSQHVADPERTLVVVNRNHLGVARDQLAELPSSNVLVQPTNLDTGPGIIFGLMHLARRARQGRVAIFPSDHFIGNEAGFLSCVRRAEDFVDQFPDKVVLLGMRPEHPETGYGYIAPGTKLSFKDADFWSVDGFHEKPPLERAHELTRSGALWNSFVMIADTGRLLELLRLTLPEEFETMAALRRDPLLANRVYRRIQPWNFSHNFLTKITEHLVVLSAAHLEWSDWGTPELIARTLQNQGGSARWQTLQLAINDLVPSAWASSATA